MTNFNIVFVFLCLMCMCIPGLAASGGITLSALEWRWLTGSSDTGANGVCGTQGQFSSSYSPGSRMYTAVTRAHNGNMYLVGGLGKPTSGASLGNLGDVWVLRRTQWSGIGSWAWIGGSSTDINYNGNYVVGSQLMGARRSFSAWATDAGLIYIFGGFGFGYDVSTPTAGYLSDIWRFNATSYKFNWLKGSSIRQSAAVYGTKGTMSPNTLPGSRELYSLLSSSATSGDAYISGGAGYDGSAAGQLSGTWKYSNVANQWTWTSGPSSRDQLSVGGAPGVFSSSFYAGGRKGAMVMDCVSRGTHSPNLVYLYGGDGYSSSAVAGRAELADLWAFDVTNHQWAFIAGESVATGTNARPSFGTLRAFSASNHPGSRKDGSGWANPETGYGLISIFGGFGYDVSGGSAGSMSDYWIFNVSTNLWSWCGGDSVIEQDGSYSTDWFSTSNKPASRYSYGSSVDHSLGAMLVFGGYRVGSSDQGFTNDLWVTQGPTIDVGISPTITPSPTPTWNPLDPTATATPSASATASPSASPTASPSASPTLSPTPSPSASPSTSPTSSPTPTASPSPSPTPTVVPGNVVPPGNGALGTGEIVGIAIGGFFLVIILVIVLLVLFTDRGRDKWYDVLDWFDEKRDGKKGRGKGKAQADKRFVRGGGGGGLGRGFQSRPGTVTRDRDRGSSSKSKVSKTGRGIPMKAQAQPGKGKGKGKEPFGGGAKGFQPRRFVSVNPG